MTNNYIKKDPSEYKTRGRPPKDDLSNYMRKKYGDIIKIVTTRKTVLNKKAINKRRRLYEEYSNLSIKPNNKLKIKDYELTSEMFEHLKINISPIIEDRNITKQVNLAQTHWNKVIKYQLTQNQFDAIIIWDLLIGHQELVNSYPFNVFLSNNNLNHIPKVVISKHDVAPYKYDILLLSLKLFKGK